VQRHTGPKSNDYQTHLELGGVRHGLQSPIVVIVTKVPHGVLGAVRRRVKGIQHLGLLKVRKRKSVCVCWPLVHQSGEHVPIVGIHNAPLECGLAWDELVLAIHGLILAPSGHSGIALRRDVELAKDAKACLTQGFCVVPDCGRPPLVEGQGHLHGSVNAEAIHIGARNQSLRHRDVFILDPNMLQAQIVHCPIELAQMNLPNVEVVLEVAIVVEVGAVVSSNASVDPRLAPLTVHWAAIVRC